MLLLIDGDVLIYRNIWKKESLEEAIESLESDISDICESLFVEDYQIALGNSSDNFRSILFSEYKKSKSRVKSRDSRSDLYDGLKRYFSNRHNVTNCNGFEADDILRIWKEEATLNNEEVIICSIDKDLNCIPGVHYDIRKKLVYSVSEKEADKFYWIQLLTGDTVDNIPGLPKVGPVKANKLLEGCDTHEECKLKVVEAYKEVYGKEWWNYLIVNGRLLHIWRSFNDHFSIPKDL
jgi:5'-3' exonuclease